MMGRWKKEEEEDRGKQRTEHWQSRWERDCCCCLDLEVPLMTTHCCHCCYWRSPYRPPCLVAERSSSGRCCCCCCLGFEDLNLGLRSLKSEQEEEQHQEHLSLRNVSL